MGAARRPLSKECAMRPKSLAITAAVALAVVVAYQKYAAKA